MLHWELRSRFASQLYSCYTWNFAAGWSSSVARRAHNPEVVGSNPAPATRNTSLAVKQPGPFVGRVFYLCITWASALAIHLSCIHESSEFHARCGNHQCWVPFGCLPIHPNPLLGLLCFRWSWLQLRGSDIRNLNNRLRKGSCAKRFDFSGEASSTNPDKTEAGAEARSQASGQANAGARP